jgi:hypothetical protein
MSGAIHKLPPYMSCTGTTLLVYKMDINFIFFRRLTELSVHYLMSPNMSSVKDAMKFRKLYFWYNNFCVIESGNARQ